MVRTVPHVSATVQGPTSAVASETPSAVRILQRILKWKIEPLALFDAQNGKYCSCEVQNARAHLYQGQNYILFPNDVLDSTHLTIK